MLIRRKRLQILIDEELDADLERLAAEEGTSKAALIRKFVRDRIRPQPDIDKDPIWGKQVCGLLVVLVPAVTQGDPEGRVDEDHR